MNKTEYQKRKELEYPDWNVLRPRKIIKCSLTGDKAWYANMIGKTVKIKQFGTFGALG